VGSLNKAISKNKFFFMTAENGSAILSVFFEHATVATVSIVGKEQHKFTSLQ
jgi:hypothetical protein